MFGSFLCAAGFDERRGRGDRGNANLDPAIELDVPANREFYKHNDVRPPYTYAALIRYVSPFYKVTCKKVISIILSLYIMTLRLKSTQCRIWCVGCTICYLNILFFLYLFFPMQFFINKLSIWSEL